MSSCRPPTICTLWRSLVPVCRAHRHRVSSGVQDVLASASAAPVQVPLLSATVAGMSTRSRSPTPLPTRAPHRRASDPGRGSGARERSGLLLGAVSGLASKCCPPLPPECMRLSDCSTSGRPAARGPGRGGAGPLASHLPEPKFFPLSSFTVDGCATRVSSPPLPCPRFSGGSADAPSRSCANKRKSLGAEGLPDSIGGNVAATLVLPVAKAFFQPASSPVVPPSVKRPSREKRRRKSTQVTEARLAGAASAPGDGDVLNVDKEAFFRMDTRGVGVADGGRKGVVASSAYQNLPTLGFSRDPEVHQK